MYVFTGKIYIIVYIMIDKLINTKELSRLLSGSDQAIRTNNIPKKYEPVVQELNDLLEYWKKRNNL